MLKKLRRLLVTGIFVLLPIGVTVELLIWGFYQLDSILGGVFRNYFKNSYRTGFGLIALLGLVILTGLFTRLYVGKRLLELGEKVIRRIPVLSVVYGTIKQITEGFSRADSVFRQVVMIEYPRRGIYRLGFLTGDSLSEAEAKTGLKMINVFVPNVPNPTSGFLVFVPVDQIIYLDMSIEEGFKFIISAGVIKPDERS